jgi:diacylglycerol kinase (ATP)
MRVCPGADPSDGLFDVTVVGAISRRELIATKPRLADGTHVRHPAVSVHRAARVELDCAGVTSYADGEPVAPLPAASECVPAVLLVVGSGRR